MAGTRKVYTPEFKLQAVQMITRKKFSRWPRWRAASATENRLHGGEEGGPQEGCRGVTAAHI